MPRRRSKALAWTPNQIVAYNLTRARVGQGWTQAEAAEALAPYLGTTLSAASWSAMERSVDSGRVRQFTADDLFAFSRAFGMPIGWFFMPPQPKFDDEDVGVATPDAERGLDPMELVDAVLGTEEMVEGWKADLEKWPPFSSIIVETAADGTRYVRGRRHLGLQHGLEDLANLRGVIAIRRRFGDLRTASDVLGQLSFFLADLAALNPGLSLEDWNADPAGAAAEAIPEPPDAETPRGD